MLAVSKAGRKDMNGGDGLGEGSSGVGREDPPNTHLHGLEEHTRCL